MISNTTKRSILRWIRMIIPGFWKVLRAIAILVPRFPRLDATHL
jgi:hypothetical protein